MATSSVASEIRLSELTDDPYPIFRQLRDTDPVAWVPAADRYLVTRYDDVMHVERNQQIFSSVEQDSLMTRAIGPALLRQDGAAHRRLRAAAEGPVRPRTVKNQWLPQFQRKRRRPHRRLRRPGRSGPVHRFRRAAGRGQPGHDPRAAGRDRRRHPGLVAGDHRRLRQLRRRRASVGALRAGLAGGRRGRAGDDPVSARAPGLQRHLLDAARRGPADPGRDPHQRQDLHRRWGQRATRRDRRRDLRRTHPPRPACRRARGHDGLAHRVRGDGPLGVPDRDVSPPGDRAHRTG